MKKEIEMPKKPSKKRSVHTIDLTYRSLPASVQLVTEVRNELKAEIGSVRHEVSTLCHEVGSQIQPVISSVHRTQALMQEQRGENRIVLDGLKNVTERQDRMGVDILEIRDTLRSLRSIPAYSN